VVRPIILANCLVKNKGKYLLVQEAQDKIRAGILMPIKGKWTFPHGGVEPGETLIEAAKRECFEETGMVIKIIRLCSVICGYSDSDIEILSFVFYGQKSGRSKARLKEEIKKINFFSREEIENLEKNNLIRENLPLSKVIHSFEQNGKVQFINWPLPEYIKEIHKKLSYGR
jgi:ADP-ribose pyrophosphatase YjhB (NUDIX family)